MKTNNPNSTTTMTPNLPPVLPGFSDPIHGNLKVPVKDENLNNTDVALLNGINEWETGYFTGEGSGNIYSLRLGSAIARANGIGGDHKREIGDDGLWTSDPHCLHEWHMKANAPTCHLDVCVKCGGERRTDKPESPKPDEAPQKISAEGFRQHLDEMLEKSKPMPGEISRALDSEIIDLIEPTPPKPEGDLIQRIESCGFECAAGPLTLSNDWREMKSDLAAARAENERLSTFREHWQHERMAGRQEFLSELIRINPEDFDKYSDAYAEHTGEYTSVWKIEALRDRFKCDESNGPYEHIEGCYWDALGRGDEARFRLKDAEAEIQLLRAALEPFAKEAAEWKIYEDGEQLVESFPQVDTQITVGDLRRASAALAPASSGKGEG